MGSDSRGDFRAEEAQAAAGSPADQRADVLMLVHIPADRQKVYGISIMRDTWVDIPGYGEAKINAGLELGGVPLMTGRWKRCSTRTSTTRCWWTSRDSGTPPTPWAAWT